MIKELNFDSNIPIRSYQFYLYPLGIISANSMYASEFILNRFTNIFYGESIQYYEKPYNDWGILKVDNIFNITRQNFIDTIINKINNGYFIHLKFINEFFLPDTLAFNKWNSKHDLLITGYDDEKKYLYTVFYNKDRIVKKYKNTFEEILNAAFYFEKNIEIECIKVNKNFSEEVDIKLIIEDLKIYLSSKNPNKNVKLTPREYSYGIECYLSLSSTMKYINDFKIGLVNDVYFIYEHTKVIFDKLKYLKDKNIIENIHLDEYEKILKKATTIKNLFVKLLITKKEKYFNRVSDLLREFSDEENKVLTKITNSINKKLSW
ncbi:hypothetical protein ACSW9V_15255 (plasmid) [Clostridium perfringens]|uniref:hypothetical protein n=1 Tax=Clostridium perfringens TaxID=1502 RepID=UPI000B370BBF|nr:hypothetical protein [Clostridium perfringens]EGT0690055.1 hypothetical protein [Clostridium perfringens]EGT0693845.1 hypothetical protein [Clostridium perfringens]MDU3376240.1 hypothetical protein [Clostridium perfringens]MDU3534196.1 hypothetical protein [Clostridium perfringens]OUN51170.1 hypothetical protein B5G18_13455 [Clostridium perfringens]